MVRIFYLIFLFLGLNAFAVDGYIEGRHVVNGNKPSYLDGTGPNIRYGVDAELRIPLFRLTKEPVKLMFGADSHGAQQGFSYIAGRTGVNIPIPIRDMEIGYFHRSEHNMDYAHTNSYRRFFSVDFVYVRYNFGRSGVNNK